jgi:hypothetical protein
MYDGGTMRTVRFGAVAGLLAQAALLGVLAGTVGLNARAPQNATQNVLFERDSPFQKFERVDGQHAQPG